VVGGFVIIAGWLGTSGTSRLSVQFNWTSLAVLGFLLASIGNGSWLLSGRRAVGARLAELTAELHEELADDSADGLLPDVSASVPAQARHSGDSLVAVPGTERYHSEACVLVRGKDAVARDLDKHVAEGLRPCELCQPAQV
jgi:hypothetical protein